LRKSCRTCFKCYCMFYFTCDRSLSTLVPCPVCVLYVPEGIIHVCVDEQLFCTAGLCLFVGIIIYIGAVTGEASNRPKSGDEPRFSYTYGPSLALTFISFISCELTAVLAVHLYISRNRRVKPAVAPSPSSPRHVDSCPPSNGRPPRGFLDRLELDSSPPRREVNDRRPQSNCSSPSIIALQSMKPARPDTKSARSVPSSFSGRVTSSFNERVTS